MQMIPVGHSLVLAIVLGIWYWFRGGRVCSILTTEFRRVASHRPRGSNASAVAEGQTWANDALGLIIKYAGPGLMLRYIHYIPHFGKQGEQTDEFSGPPIMLPGRPFLVRTKLQGQPSILALC